MRLLLGRMPIEVVSRDDGPAGVVDLTTPRRPPERRGSTARSAPMTSRCGDYPIRSTAPDRFAAPACDDLAGVAAALAALDRARHDPALAHFGVMLTRAEEVGLIGAIHAAKQATIPAGVASPLHRDVPGASQRPDRWRPDPPDR